MTILKHDILTISCNLVHHTDHAYLIRSPYTFVKIWVPRSQCEYSNGELQIPRWLAEKKDLLPPNKRDELVTSW